MPLVVEEGPRRGRIVLGKQLRAIFRREHRDEIGNLTRKCPKIAGGKNTKIGTSLRIVVPYYDTTTKSYVLRQSLGQETVRVIE